MNAKKKSKHILVVSQYFYPEQFRINDICKEWVKRGYKVTVVTGIPNYPEGRFYPRYGIFKRKKEVVEGVTILRVPIVSRGQNPFQLMCNYLSFIGAGWLWNRRTRLKADYVFIYGMSPITQALPGIGYAKKHKIPCYLYVMDLWPESVEFAAGIHNQWILRRIGMMVNYIYRNCDHVFTSSKSFIWAIRKRGITKEKLSFWPQYAEEFYQPYASLRNADTENTPCFKILFAGNIGMAQGLEILPKTAKILEQTNESVLFCILGDGRFKSTLIEQVEAKKVSSFFRFIERKPAQEIPRYMAACDAALICLSKSEIFSATIPAKVQSSMACGVPILVSADGEVQKIIGEAGCGYSSAAGNAVQLADNIRKMKELTKEERIKMGKNALFYSKKHFNKEKLLDVMDSYFRR